MANSPFEQNFMRSLGGRLRDGMLDAPGSRAANNREALLRDLRSDPETPAFQRALAHLQTSILHYDADPGQPGPRQAVRLSVRLHLAALPAEQLADLATFGVMFAMACIEVEQEEHRAAHLATSKDIGPVRDLPPILRSKLPADADPDGIAYWDGEEPNRSVRVREAAYEARAKEAAELLARPVAAEGSTDAS